MIPQSEPLHLALFDTTSNELPEGHNLNEDLLKQSKVFISRLLP